MSQLPRRINPDTRPVLVVAASLTAVLGGVSFLLSYNGLTATAPWASIPAGQAWTIPVVIDGAILVYTLAVLIKRRRGERAVLYWSLLAAFTAVSVAGNAFHAWDASAQDSTGMAGAAIAGLAPLAVLAATHTLADLIVEPAPARIAQPEVRSDVTPIERADAMTLSEDEPVSREQAVVTRARAGLSQRRIAAELGMSKSTVGRILTSASVEVE
ncbi:DUF2637 domain-containing protein [Agromyces aureus]|uniref:Uncharacterized protein n=1 Tax=Agromyces aureus TaxID=453304 RepID=A0A191WBU1_9MICO|nr:DUF2637 domain-containing protein [Agromyces aureus]ANJ25726.1 hypothetical protein ATC03_02050 [Agromyces aureus]